jgi:hypothetical protein
MLAGLPDMGWKPQAETVVIAIIRLSTNRVISAPLVPLLFRAGETPHFPLQKYLLLPAIRAILGGGIRLNVN